MQYHKEEIKRTYDTFFEIEKNQIEIFQELRSAFIALTGLSSFDGQMAISCKSFVEEVHISVLDTFNIAMMELEIRLLALKQDFEGSVDDSATAILDEQFIADKRYALTQHGAKAEEIHTAANDAVSGITQYMSFAPLPYSDIFDAIRSTYDKCSDVITSMQDFNARHAGDLDDFNGVFPQVDQAIAYIDSVITPTSICYSKGDISSLAWAGRMSDYRTLAYVYAYDADPRLYETFYMAIITQCGLDILGFYLYEEGVDVGAIRKALREGSDVLEIVGASEVTADAWTAIRFYRSGLVFSAVSEGEGVYIKITSRAGRELSNAERVAALNKMGAPVPRSNSTLTSLFFKDEGLCVWGNNRQYSMLFGQVDNWDEAAELAKQIKLGDFSEAGSVSKLGKFMKVGAKVGNVASIVGDAVTIVLDVADGFYNERTESFSGDFDTAKIVGSLAIDGALIAFDYGLVVGGAAIGTAICPVFGTAVGTAVGIGVGMLFELMNSEEFEYGEPSKSFLEHAKGFVGDVAENVGNWFAKVFW